MDININNHEQMQSINQMIEKYGHSVIGVFGDPLKPSFSYTVGLADKYNFELIIVGMNPKIATVIFNDIGDYLSQGNEIDLNAPVDLFTNLPARFIECQLEKVSEYATVALSRNPTAKIIQMVMCDRQSNFPDEPNYDHEYMDDRQTLLYKIVTH